MTSIWIEILLSTYCYEFSNEFKDLFTRSKNKKLYLNKYFENKYEN